jgi:predicted nucleotidyltransferase
MGNITKSYSIDTKKIIEICRQNDVSKVGIFGSLARGDANENSDVDLIVEFSKKSLLSMVSLERKIATAIGRKVDLLTEQSISPYLRDRIHREVKALYEAR